MSTTRDNQWDAPSAQEAAEIAALVVRFQRGDEEAFLRILTRYHRRIACYAANYAQDVDDRDDLLQEITIQLYKSLKNFRGDASANTYIYAVIRNVCRSFLRQMRRRLKRIITLPKQQDDGEDQFEREVSADEPLDDALHRKERERALERMLREMPKAQREMLTLRDVLGMSYEEIAEIMALPIGTVKSRLSRARAMLQEKILQKAELFPPRVNSIR